MSVTLRHWLAQTGISPTKLAKSQACHALCVIGHLHSCTLQYRLNTNAMYDQYHICGNGGCYVCQTLALQQQRAVELWDKHRVCVSVYTEDHGVSVYSLKCGS